MMRWPANRAENDFRQPEFPTVMKLISPLHLIACGTVLIGAMLTAGCATSPVYTDIPQSEAPQWIGARQLNSPPGSQILTVSFLKDAPELSIERLGYQVRSGNLYLWPERGIHRFHPISFDLDTSKLHLDKPWRDHVYWLLEDQWDGPLERVEQPTKGQYVKRIHASVSESPPPGSTSRSTSQPARLR
jgi:hypothetical protein